MDKYYDEEPKFTTPVYGLPVMIKSPEDLTDPSGYNFVKDHINGLEAALAAPDFADTGAYRELIDLDTFVKFLLINEITGNEDAGIPRSVYMYRNKDGKKNDKICMGPLWDFDRGFGYSGEGNEYFKNSNYHVNWHPFFKRFFDDPVFKKRYKEIWNEYRNDIEGIASFIDGTAAKLDASQRANFTVWQWLNEPDYWNEIAKIKSWWNARISYLNTEINGL
jgi:spore coat protein CotH